MQGPSFNDEFGDTFGNVYAFTADGFSYRELQRLCRNGAGRTDARAGRRQDPVRRHSEREDLSGILDPADWRRWGSTATRSSPNFRRRTPWLRPAWFRPATERVTVRVSGEFTSEESLKAINLRVGGKFYRLADLAQVRRGYADPPSPIFRYNGEPAIGMAISMAAGGNVLDFGKGIQERMRQVEANLPVGIGIHLVADQSVVVEEAVAGFTKALIEAVIIVLAVSFISLGMRAGIVVACSIPLVLAMTFIGHGILGISLQRISLGALIIALGLLVDDAMIAVEMMVARLEEGDSLR